MNGKVSNVAVLAEMESMNNAFKKHIIEDKERFDGFDGQLANMNKNVEEILDIMRAFSLGKNFILGLGIFIGSIIAIIVGLKQLVGWLQ